MNDIVKLVVYIFQNYPNVDELSKPRLVKLLYLIDWKHSIDYGQQATPIKWYFNHYGPYVDTVIDLIKSSPEIFNVKSRTNAYGGISDKIGLKKNINVVINDSVRKSTDFIILNTAKRNWTDFINLVYSTYPIRTNSKYTYLDLINNAKEFKHYRQQSI